MYQSKKTKIEYTKPEVVDLGPVTYAIGGYCLDGDVYSSTCGPGGSPTETCNATGDFVYT